MRPIPLPHDVHTATGVSNVDTTDDASLATFTANEPTTDFVEPTTSPRTLSSPRSPPRSTPPPLPRRPGPPPSPSMPPHRWRRQRQPRRHPLYLDLRQQPGRKADVTGTLKATGALRFTNTSFRPVIRRLSWLRHNPESTDSRQGIKVTLRSFVKRIRQRHQSGLSSGV